MASKGKKRLYKATNFAELQALTKVPAANVLKVKPAIQSLDKLFKEAEKQLKDGDEEMAYVYFMKYLGVLQAIMSKSEYKDDKKYHDSMIGVTNRFPKALNMSEELSSSLENRYTALADEKKERSLEKKLALASLKEETVKKREEKENVENQPVDYNIMEPKQLHSLIAQKAKNFLLLDVRSQRDYGRSHIKHTYSLNIPEQLLVPGTTAKKLESTISAQHRSQWMNRAKVDMLIFFDWSSKDVEKGGKLEVLKDAMFKWDTGTKYACGKLHLLKGGFENFYMHYPMELTDATQAKIMAQERRDLKTKKSQKLAPCVRNLQYPDLDQAFLKTPDESPNTSEDLTTSTSSMGAPFIPDRATKPKIGMDSSSKFNEAKLEIEASSSTLSSMTSGSSLNDAFINTKSLTVDESIGPPKVDRSLKARALLNNDKASSKATVLEAEKELIEDSFHMEQQELKLEKEWEILKLKREREAEQEMREEIAKKEEALLERLEKLERDRETRDKENEELRDQLQKMRQQMDQKATLHNEEEVERRVKETIRQKEQERRRLQAEVELKRRKRKLEQAKRHEEEQRRRDLERMDSESSMRSAHSSPNIAQMLEDEAAQDNVPTPRFDRNSKPGTVIKARARDFQPVWGTGKKGLTGLKNLGNTCYMNSILQCLSNFTLPSQYFINHTFERDLNNNSESRGEVALEFSKVIEAMWSGQFKYIAPTDFKHVVGKNSELFRGTSQQDAHEFLTKLMDWLNDDLNEVRTKVLLPEVDFSKMGDLRAAEAAWELQKKVERSFTQEMFFGQTRSTCECTSCGYRSFKFEKFLGLNLNLPSGGGKSSIQACITDDLLKEEVVDYICEKCRNPRNKAIKRLEIVKLPLILIVHLKRFYRDYDMDVWRKKTNFIDFDMNCFNAGKFVTACQGQLNKYDKFKLYGVCNHFGTLEGGHYTAYCYSQVYDKWHKYDDQEVSPMSPSEVKTSAAYILFYSALN